MRILGIESASLVASTAVWEDDQILFEGMLNHKKTHSQTLLPMLQELLQLADVELSSIDAIAISKGPGSFTGLRIGAATAKGLALALHIPLVEVSTLEATAYQFFETTALISPIMDARRQQVYCALYAMDGAALNTLEGDQALGIHEWMEKVNSYGNKVIFLGDGVPPYKAVIEKEATVPVCFAPGHMSRQRGSAVAALGAKYFAEGRGMQGEDFQPTYLRKPQAEREREEGVRHA